MKHPFLWLIRGYQRGISPFLPPTCRYHPSCSEYAYIAIDRHGIFKGGGMALWRLLRCNPWSPGGYDPVDQSDRERHDQAIAARDAQAGAPTGMSH